MPCNPSPATKLRRLFPLAGFRAASALLVAVTLFAIGAAWPATAQISIPGVTKESGKADKASAADKPLDELRRQAETDLEEVRQKLEENAAIQPVDAAAAADKEARQRLLDILLYFRNEKLWRLNALAALKETAQTPVASLPAVKALGDSPPYSALRVDALRDELDAQNERLQSLQNSVQMREGEKQSLSERVRKTGEQARLANDKAAYEKSDASRRERDIAELKKQIAEVELATQVADQEYLQAQIGEIRQRTEEMGRILAGVLPAQQLSESDQAERREALREAQEKVSAEVDRVAARHAKRLAERQRLLAAARDGGNGAKTGEENSGKAAEKTAGKAAEKAAESASRLAFIDLALRADGMALEGLRTLQLLEQFHANAWEQRIILLSPDSAAEARQNALDALRQIAENLNDKGRKESRLQQVTTTQESLRAMIADLEARAAGPAQNGAPQNGAMPGVEEKEAKELLSLYRNALSIYERIAQQVRRLNQETARWIGDFTGKRDKAASGLGVVGMGVAGGLASVTDLAQALAGYEPADLWQAVKRIAYSVWNYELFAVEDTSQVDGQKVTVSYGITVGKSIGAILLFGFGYWLFARITKRILKLLVERGNVNAQVASVTRRWLMISVSALLAISILNLARIPLTVFTFVGGALAIGVGFGTQTIIKNFISGIILLFERKVRVGDIVVIGGINGTVTNVDLRATTVKAFDGTEALIPNSSVLENQVINWTYSDPRLRREIRLQIAYGSPVRDAVNLIQECAQTHGQVLKNPAPEVYFDGFGDSGLDIAMTFWVELGANTNGRRIDSDLRFMIEKRLAAAGIGIPFPTREVNLNASRPLPVTLAAADATDTKAESKAKPAPENREANKAAQAAHAAHGTHAPADKSTERTTQAGQPAAGAERHGNPT